MSWSDAALADVLERMALFAGDSGPTIRARIARDTGDTLIARRGSRWRIASAASPGRFLTDSDLHAERIAPPLDGLLRHPLSLAASHTLRVAGEVDHDGRPATRVRADPRQPPSHRLAPFLVIAGAVEVDIDSSGLVLAVRDHNGDEVLHLLDVEIGGVVDDAVLVPPPPPAARRQSASPIQLRDVTLAEAAATAGFAVFRPTLLPEGATLDTQLRDDPRLPTQVLMRATPPSGRWAIGLTEEAAAGTRRHNSVDTDVETVERDGLAYEMWTNAGATMVAVRRDGTDVTLRGPYPRSDLLRVAGSLVRQVAG